MLCDCLLTSCTAIQYLVYRDFPDEQQRQLAATAAASSQSGTVPNGNAKKTPKTLRKKNKHKSDAMEVDRNKEGNDDDEDDADDDDEDEEDEEDDDDEDDEDDDEEDDEDDDDERIEREVTHEKPFITELVQHLRQHSYLTLPFEHKVRALEYLCNDLLQTSQIRYVALDSNVRLEDRHNGNSSLYPCAPVMQSVRELSERPKSSDSCASSSTNTAPRRVSSPSK